MKISAAASFALALLGALTAFTLHAAGELPTGADLRVAPLTKAMFNQGTHFNRMCPLGNSSSPDQRCYAGCTAVAQSIVMAFYRWPYQAANGAIAYDWENLPDACGNAMPAKSVLAVANLLSDTGLSLPVTYGTSSTAADFLDVSRSLRRDFGFTDASAGELDMTGGITAAHHAAIQAQLDAGHPVLCSGAAGAGTGSGHTYVCDGYALTNGVPIYHFNFGWGGRGNSWWPLDGVVTQAVASDTDSVTPHPVLRAIVDVLPQSAPVITAPGATAATDAPTVAWTVPNCWTNSLTGFTVERQTKGEAQVNQEITTADWMLSNADTGWSIGDYVSGAAISFGGVCWPGVGSAAVFVKTPLTISKGNTLTIRYRARQFDSGVTLRLVKAIADPQFDGDYTIYDGSTELPTIATLSGGSSTSALGDVITRVITSDQLVAAYGELESDAHFTIMFDYASCSYPAGTEVFRLESLTLSGTGTAWQTEESHDVAATARECAFTGLAAGDHRFVVTAHYGDNDYADSRETTIGVTAPTVTVAAASSASVSFTVSGSSAYTYAFTCQNDSLAGTAAKNGNTITYTFTDADAVGTHWLKLTVTDTATQAVGEAVYVTNPPEDHALTPDLALTMKEAVYRALKEKKPIFLFATGDIDNAKFKTVRTVLASDKVVNAIHDKYIFHEAHDNVPDEQDFIRSIWRQQTSGSTAGMAFYPQIYAYGFIIDPTAPDRVVEPTASVNTQLDLTSFLYNADTSIANFLAQDFGLDPSAWPDPEEAEDDPGEDDPPTPSRALRLLIK